MLVRVLENPSGTAAILQIDQDGTAGGMNWTTIARLDGVHTGDGVKVILDSSQPAGVTLTAPALVPTKNFDGDVTADILWQNDNGMPAIWLMNGTSAVTVSGVGSFNPGPSWHVKGSRRLQRRRQVRHPVAGQRWHARDLADGRHHRRVGRCRRLVQSGAELAGQGHRRLQRRRQVRHPVAGQRRRRRRSG